MGAFYEETHEVKILRERIEELGRIRQGFASHLGSSLYEATKDDPNLRWGRESLYDGISSCDAERDRLLKRIDALNASTETDDEPEVESEPQVETVDDLVPEPEPEVATESETVVESETEITSEPAAEPETEPEPEVDDAMQDDNVQAEVEETNPEPFQDESALPVEEEPVVEAGEEEPVSDGHEEAQVPPEVTSEISLDQTVVREPVVQQGNSVLTCPSCGYFVNETDKFCMSCGYPLASRRPKTCPNCGRTVEDGYKFCIGCGQKL